MKKISDYLWRIAGWKTFVVALAVYMIFGGYVMPKGAEHINQLNGAGCKILDLQFHYTPNEAREIISCYTAEGRAFAIKFNLIADSVYPVCYTFLFIIIIGWIYKSVAQKNGAVPAYIHLLPLVTTILDYCENTGIVIMHSSYPDVSNTTATVTAALTAAKWSSLAVQLIIIIYGLLMLVVPQLRRKV
jgi:hypothetical protein